MQEYLQPDVGDELYLTRIKDQIKRALPQYMALHNYKLYNGRGKFRCFNYTAHAHNDTNPSASVTTNEKNEPYFHCFVCQESGDTFKAAKWIENLPDCGSDFVTVTIPRLCDQLGIPFELKQLPKKDIDRKRGLDALQKTSDYITNNADLSILAKRGITDTDSKHFRIGTGSFDLMLSELRKTYPDQTLRSAGIIQGKDEDTISENGNYMFMENSIILTIHNSFGVPVGFVRRDLDFEDKKAKGISAQKYFNTVNSKDGDTEYYNKSKILYLMHLAKKSIGQSKEAYVFEGYIDVITAHKSGITNSVALGGVAFTQEHLNLLTDAKAETVILCLDNDAEGIRSTFRNANALFKNRNDIYLKVLEMDEPGEDPDSYIKKYGSNRFNALPRLDFIEWSIKHTPDVDINEVSMNKIIEDIVRYTTSPVAHNKYAKAISARWNIDANAVEDEIKIKRENNQDKVDGEIRKLISDMTNKLTYESNSDKIVNIIEATLTNIELRLVNNISKRDILARERESLDSIENAYLKMIPDPIKLGMLDRFGKNLDVPKDGCLICVPGREHHGKSTFMRQLAIDVAASNPDVIVLYYTLDDSKKLSVPGFIGCLTKCRMNAVRNYNSDHISPTEREKVLEGFEKLRKLSVNFKLRDVSEVSSIEGIKKDILVYRNIYGRDKKFNVFIDAFNDLHDCVSGSDKRVAIDASISRLKSMTTKYGCNIWLTNHLRKQSGRPTNDDIKESGAIAYLADILILVYNELLDQGNAANLKKQAPEDRSYPFYPILDVNVTKNKVTDMRGRKLFLMHSDEGWCEELSALEEKEYLNHIDMSEAKKGSLVKIGSMSSYANTAPRIFDEVPKPTETPMF